MEGSIPTGFQNTQGHFQVPGNNVVIPHSLHNQQNTTAAQEMSMLRFAKFFQLAQHMDPFMMNEQQQQVSAGPSPAGTAQLPSTHNLALAQSSVQSDKSTDGGFKAKLLQSIQTDPDIREAVLQIAKTALQEEEPQDTPSKVTFVKVTQSDGTKFTWQVTPAEFQELTEKRRESSMIIRILKKLHPLTDLKHMLLTGVSRKNNKAIKLPVRTVDIITAALLKYVWSLRDEYRKDPVKFDALHHKYCMSVRTAITKMLEWFHKNYNDDGVRKATNAVPGKAGGATKKTCASTSATTEGEESHDSSHSSLQLSYATYPPNIEFIESSSADDSDVIIQDYNATLNHTHEAPQVYTYEAIQNDTYEASQNDNFDNSLPVFSQKQVEAASRQINKTTEPYTPQSKDITIPSEYIKEHAKLTTSLQEAAHSSPAPPDTHGKCLNTPIGQHAQDDGQRQSPPPKRRALHDNEHNISIITQSSQPLKGNDHDDTRRPKRAMKPSEKLRNVLAASTSSDPPQAKANAKGRPRGAKAKAPTTASTSSSSRGRKPAAERAGDSLAKDAEVAGDEGDKFHFAPLRA